MPFATDEEIRIAHDVLLRGKRPFDETRVNIIKEDSSCYVQACPGSGKTTALLAKLIILANKMPLPEGKGVCVLTHTNVAIDARKAQMRQYLVQKMNECRSMSYHSYAASFPDISMRGYGTMRCPYIKDLKR